MDLAEHRGQAGNEIGPDESTIFDRISRKVTVPVATLTSFIALVIPAIGLIKTAETALDTTPVITVFPNSSTDKHLDLMFYNAGDRIAHIEKAAMKVFVYKNSAQDDVRMEIDEKQLKLTDKANAILNPKKNNPVILEPVETNWIDAELDSWPTPKRESFFAENTYCYLSLVIRDTKSRDIIKPDEVILSDKECSNFVVYRYGNTG